MSGTVKKETFDISLNQLNILRQEESAKGTAINSIASTVRFSGVADPVLLSETVKNVIRSDASLRIALTEKNGRVVQYHADFAVPEIPVLDFSTSDEAFYLKWAESRAKEPIYALNAPLFRFFICILGENTLCLFVCTHHIISDGWSHMALCNRIATVYLQAVAGKTQEIPATHNYADYIASEREYLASDKYAEDKAYWQEVLSSARDTVALKPVKGASVSNVGARKTFPLSVTLNNSIYAYCMNRGVSPFGVYYAALAACLRRGGCGDRITIGVPVFNRSNFRFKNTTGMFVSTLPFTCDVDDTLSLNAFCEVYQKTWTDTLRHQRFPYADMLPMAEEDGRLFHMMLSYQSCPRISFPGAACRVSGIWHYCGFQNEQLCIQVTDFNGKNEYSVNYDWLVQLYTETEISNLHTHICRILYAALEDPDRPLNRIVLADSAEKEQVVYTNNAAAGNPAPFSAPYELFRSHAEARPGAAAVIFRDRRTSYAELAGMGRKVAAAIGGADKLCAVLLPKCEWSYASMIGILQAGSAFCSISTDQPEERIRAILKSSAADVLLTDPAHAAVFASDVPLCLDVTTLAAESEKIADVDADRLAYVVYTSGSTGTPKGVEIGCGSFVNLCSAMSGYYSDGAVLSLCNTGFDAFILESAAAMCNGKTVVLADDEEKDNPAVLAALIERYGVKFLALTPSRLQVFLHSEAFRHAAGQLKTVICGGEAFPSDLLRTLKKYTKAAIYNQYGPSETTVAVSMSALENADRITAGKPMPGCHLYVLDDCMHPLPENFTGELYIGGACVGKGYRNAPELTEQSFLSSPFLAEERLYKTGDAARWNSFGEIEILGRKDTQVKLRGLRVEPQEISSCLSRYPGVKAAAVKAAEWNGQTVLFAYYVAETELPETDLLAFAAAYLPRYMIPARILRIAAVPLTANGKIDERRLPVPEESSEEVLPANRTQARILSIFRKTLKNEKIHAGSDYFLSGGNSLSAMETLAAIEEEFGVRMPVSALNACRTAVLTGEYIRSRMTAGSEWTEKPVHAPSKEAYDLSATQKSIYFASMLDSTGKAYLMPCAFELPEGIDCERLCAAFEKMTAGDPIFRTSFAQKEGKVVASVAAAVAFSMPVFENRTEADEWLLQPFDLSAAPLFRAAIVKAQGCTQLLLCAHHLICDGLSVPVILERLDCFYRGDEAADYLTFSEGEWYLRNTVSENLPEQRKYWKGKLGGCPAFTDIPPDFPRPAVFDGKGAIECVHFGAHVKAAAEELCKKYGITEYMLFSAVFGILFSRISGEKNVVIGTPVSGRRTSGFERIVGPLMRTVPLLLSAEGNCAGYLDAVRVSVTEMIDNSDCSETDIVEALELPHRRDRNSLYQILFQMRPVNTEEFLLDGKKLNFIPIPTGVAKLDLFAEAFPEGDGYGLQLEYASSVYLPETVRGWGESIGRLILTLAGALPEQAVSDLRLTPVLPETRTVPFPFRSLQEEIHAATLANPDKPALIWHDAAYSFAALETLSCRLVRQLRKAGVGKGDRVGIVMERTPLLFAGLLAILRCGAAYVPFLSSFPADRIQYMMQTAQVRCVLCDFASRGSTVECDFPVLTADETAEPDMTLTVSGQQDPIYVLFTSGSTGRPKGVQLPQRALSNLLKEERKLMKGLQGPVLCSTGCTFDIFSTESILALAQGFTVILADDAEMLHPWMLAELHRKYQPQITQYTPSRLEMCLKNAEFASAQGSVRFTILVGENVPAALVRTFYAHTTEARLVNMYGPTEAAVYVTAGDLKPGENITVGKPLENCRLYILNEKMIPVLPGEKGELYIAGICLADGYISQSELTGQLFPDDPFCPGDKMYRSGDVFRLRADGNYECFGRRDGQIKINGIRVETDEINAVLVRCGAESAVTLVTRNADGSSRLESAVTPAAADAESLRKAASELLPAFMMPSKIAPIPEIPFNSSGKADIPRIRRLLEESSENRRSAENGRTLSAAEKSVLEIWEKIIGFSGLSPDVSFFRQGGSSLSALNVIGEYYNRGLSMTLEAFFSHPTAREQAELLLHVSGEKAGRGTSHAGQTGKRQVPALPDSGTENGDVLLTGATGFLGAHLLRELLKTREGQIICLLRGGSRERLNQSLRYYFGEEFTDSERIEVADGDILKKDLGLSDEKRQDIAARVTLIVHAAADVRHYASDDSLYRTNCEGSANVADFALRYGAELAHISTASICGERVEGQPDRNWIFTEDCFDIGQNRSNRYIAGKIAAEEKVFSAMEKGLTARIFRVGRLTGRYADGKFQKNRDENAFCRVVQGLYAVGGLPDTIADLPLELLPVDICAEEIVSLLHASSAVYHVVQPNPLTMREILPMLREPVAVLPEEDFARNLRKVSAGHPEKTGALVDFIQQVREPVHIFLSSEKTRMHLGLVRYRIPADLGHSLEQI